MPCGALAASLLKLLLVRWVELLSCVIWEASCTFVSISNVLLSKDVPWVWDHPWNLMYFSWLDVTYHQTKEMVPGFISTVVESISMTIIRQLIMLNLALATPWCWWHYFLDWCGVWLLFCRLYVLWLFSLHKLLSSGAFKEINCGFSEQKHSLSELECRR